MYSYDFRIQGESILKFEWEKFQLLQKGNKVRLPNGKFNIKLSEVDRVEKCIIYEVEPLIHVYSKQS